METINKGTKEVLFFNLDDRLNQITDLAPYTVEYRVTDEEESELVAWSVVEDVNLMRVDVLLDTTPAGFVDGMTLKIYIRPNIPPEAPILGPFEVGLS